MNKKKLLLVIGLVFIVFLLIAVTSVGLLIFLVTSHSPATGATGSILARRRGLAG